jgi:UDP:flavonoid glycosyltransferase YjiC (YdhE family)
VVVHVLVVTWAPGGNLPPMLAAASVLDRRGHEVTILASGKTRAAAQELGFAVTGYWRSPDPDVGVAFENQADLLMASAAGAEIALDTRDVFDELRPDLAVIDCMLPAAIAAARATGTPAASLVHFLYGLARTQMRRVGGGWTTDLRSLAATHRMLGLAPARDGLAAWEAPELVLVTAPRWLDIDCDAPLNVLHAGPLGVAVGRQSPRRTDVHRQPVLVTFSTTVMNGQRALIDRVCEAVAGLDLDVVLTLGPAVDHDDIRVPDNVAVLPFADHDRLLPSTAAVISHGGLGTVLRAVAHGVPQLLLPLGRDQGFNASRVEQLGAGIQLPTDAQPQQIQTTMRTLIADKRFAAAAGLLARRLAAEEPDRTAAEALEHTAGRGI